ncbi:MAG TPA: hypothetical protein VL099_13125 [Candidatus Binatia bacterium]|nr:hypothetical protein [Candidatus Binatia bacterium]
MITHPLKFLVAACAALLLGPVVQTLSGTSDSSQGEFVAILAHASCAPWDGPAVAIEFYTTPTRCGEAKIARLNINLWRNLPLKAGQKFELSRATTTGVASLCARENQCEAAESGTVWIEEFEAGKSVSGRYEFSFQRAGRRAGKFRAKWCDLRMMCG